MSGMLSPEGRCKTLDASADGYVRAEACGVLLLDRLSTGHRPPAGVVALLVGTALNQDGRSSSLTAPNGPAQQRVIREALSSARLRADAVKVLQLHGTGVCPFPKSLTMSVFIFKLFGNKSISNLHNLPIHSSS